jgi:uncharacterized membrane protein YcaP (DUF421 family)
MAGIDGITTSLDSVIVVLISAVVVYAALMLYTRMAGLRSFSKMSSFDFAVTVAIGSTVASIILNREPPLLLGLVGLGLFYGLQMIVATLRCRSGTIRKLVDNAPLLLMSRGRMLEANMRKAKVTRADLMAKLREANVLKLSDVRAVVMEATGDISVLHADDAETSGIEAAILQDVQGREHDE